MKIRVSNGLLGVVATLAVAIGCRAPGSGAAVSHSALSRTPTVPSTSGTLDKGARRTDVKPVSYQEASANPEPDDGSQDFGGTRRDEQLPAPGAARSQLDAVENAPEELPTTLALQQVKESVYYSFPALEALLREIDIAEGKNLSSYGEFDLKVKADSISAPLGFYKNYRNLVRLEQPTWQGGTAYAHYRIGDGSFQPWYGERETNEGGEFRVGFLASILRGRAIDERRADIFRTTLARQQVDPEVRAALLEFTLAASEVYWSWVAAGRGLAVQRELLKITVERNRIYEVRVKNKDLAEIELVQNERLIAARRAKVIEAERKVQQYAIKLSLYVRDLNGNPLLPPPNLLPSGFPERERPDLANQSADIGTALVQRPELSELDFLQRQIEVDRSLAHNQMLPTLSAGIDASKDVGAPASKKGDKTPFELEAGLFFEVPYQRRKAQGKIIEADGKLAQIAAKRRFLENKIEIQVRDALSALATAYDRTIQTHESTRLAERLAEAERKRFEEQDSDLLRVAIQEAAAIEAELAEIDALSDYFQAEAALRAAVGTDPLER